MKKSKKQFPKDFWNHNLNPITGQPAEKVLHKNRQGVTYEFAQKQLQTKISQI